MKLIVGLGNPGEQYKGTRHNVGFMVVDALVSKINKWRQDKKAKALYCSASIKGQKIEFVKPQTFMNKSGYSVRYVYKKNSLKPSDLFVVHDDLDLALGSYKIQKGKGPRKHGGVLSIEKGLGTKDFWRVRIGVDNRGQSLEVGRKVSGEEYVLENFLPEEKKVFDELVKKVVEKIIDKLAIQLSDN